MVNEKSFVCKEKPVYWDYMDGHTKNTLDGKYIAVTSPGTSLIYFPSLAIANIFNEGHTIENDYFMSYNGHTLYDGIAILFTAITLNLLSLFLIFKSLRILRFSRRISLLSITSVAICSYSLWYVFLMPIFTHTSEIFSVSLLLYLYLKQVQTKAKIYIFFISCSIGLLVLVRPILLPVGLYFLFAILMKTYYKKYSKSFFKDLTYITLGALPFLIIYILYNYQSYGTYITSGYGSVRNETFSTTFNGLNILFSPYKGWFIYSPLMLLAIVGLFKLYKKERTLSLISVLSILTTVCIYGFWPNWWGGGSLGARFLLFSVPFCSIGIAEIFRIIQNAKYKAYTLGLLSIVFVFSLNQMFLFRISPVESDKYTPLSFYNYHYEQITKELSSQSIIELEKSNLQSGSGFMILLAGISNPVILFNNDDTSTNISLIKAPFNNKISVDRIDGYIFLNSTKTFKELSLMNLNTTNELTLVCGSVSCTSSSQDVNLGSSIDKSNDKFEVKDYAAINIGSAGTLILKRVKGVQYRGELLHWDPTNPYFLFDDAVVK